MERFTSFDNNTSASNITGGFMNKVQSITSNLNTSSILILVAIIIFIFIGVSYYYFYVVPSSNAMYRANRELIDGKGDQPEGEGGDGDREGKEVELLFFYADWCPHSKSAKPIWDELQKKYENKTLYGYKIIFTLINSTDDSADVEKMMDKYNIEGFPTIKLLKDGQVIEYDAKPSKDTLEQFLDTVLK